MAEARKQEPLPDATEEWVSLEAARQLLGMSRERVLNLALRGTLTVDHRAHLTFVSRASIEQLIASRVAGATTE
jgi:hypothetical protein